MMDVLSHWIARIELLVPVLVLVAVSLQRWKTGMRATWQQEAEIYMSRSERLTLEVEELRSEIVILRKENKELKDQITQLVQQGNARESES